MPAGKPGLGITIEGGYLRFEFADGQQTIELSARQLQHRLSR
jgi:hypothetical protein